MKKTLMLLAIGGVSLLLANTTQFAAQKKAAKSKMEISKTVKVAMKDAQGKDIGTVTVSPKGRRRPTRAGLEGPDARGTTPCTFIRLACAKRLRLLPLDLTSILLVKSTAWKVLTDRMPAT